MTDQPDLREQITALFRSAPGVERLGNATPGEIADAVLAVLPGGWDRFVSTIEQLRQEREQACAEVAESRRLMDAWMQRHRDAQTAIGDLIGIKPGPTADWHGVVGEFRRMLARVEASRRDWATEAESLDAARAMVVERLTEEIRWQKHAYGGEPRDSTNRAALGRTIGMEDALRTVENTFAEAELERSQCSRHPREGGGNRD